MTRRVAVAGIAVVWLLAGLISFVPISLGLHRADEPADNGKEVHRYRLTFQDGKNIDHERELQRYFKINAKLMFETILRLFFDHFVFQEHPTCTLELTPTYAVVSSSISFYVPCIVMLGIYCR